MATQIRILQQICKPDTDIVIREEEFRIDESFCEDIVFKFYETDKIYLTFFADKDTEIEYEDFASEEMKKVVLGERILFSSGDDSLGAYAVGKFEINVSIKGKFYTFFFLVQPKNLAYLNVLNLRTYVDNFYAGLSLDLQKKRKIKASFVQDFNSSTFVDYNYLSENFVEIMDQINSYINFKYVEPVKEKIITRKPSKIGPDSIKWVAKNGLFYNENFDKLSTMLVSKTRFSLDNYQNKVFKSELMFWDNELKAIVNTIEKYYLSLKENVSNYKEEITKLEEHYNAIDKQKMVSELIKKTEYNDINRKKEECSNLINTIVDYETRIDKINHFKRVLENAEYNSWVKNVKISSSNFNSDVTNKRLVILREQREKYLGTKRKLNKDKDGKMINYFGEKSTSKLFETYVYILLIELLNSLGFVVDETDLDKDLMFTLSNPGTITLRNENGLCCDIIYDTEVKKINAKFEKSEYCSTNGLHRRPDFILSFYEEEAKPLLGIVLDAKCRPLRNIYNEVGETDVVLSLEDYQSFAYYDFDSNKAKRNFISKVIAIYPDIEERVTDMENGDIFAIGINISNDIKNSSGYLNIKNNICDLLEELKK